MHAFDINGINMYSVCILVSICTSVYIVCMLYILDLSCHLCISSRNVDQKREDYLEWPEYFMAVAFLSAMRSKDPVSQVGACIVNPENRIVGVGYNGMPIGCSDDLLPWSKTSENRLETKYMYGKCLFNG